MRNFKKTMLAMSGFIAGLVGALALTTMALADGAADSPAPSLTPDKRAAEQAAGYGIVTPGNMPVQMQLQFYLVSGETSSNKADVVEQEWHHQGDGSKQWITVAQGPIPMGLMDGEPTTISGVAGERVLYEARPNRPYQVLALYWPHDAGHRGVVGSLVDDQTEDTLRAVADSLVSD